MIHLQVDQDTKEYELYENADYQSFWSGIQQKKLDELEQILIRRMLHLPARRIIDIGCGYGRLLDSYQEKSNQIVLLDSSASLLQKAYQQSNGRAICLRCDLNHIPFKDSAFDQVLMIRVFHHLPDSSACLREVNRILTGGGHFLFSYCNKKNLERIARWVIGKNPYNPFRIETNWVWNVFFMHHPDYIHSLLLDTGFEHITENGAGIVDKIAGKLGRLGANMPPGVTLAPFFAKFAWAPWIFSDSSKTGEPDGFIDAPIEKLFQCLNCHSDLSMSAEGCRCVSCGKFYPIKEGVIHFLNPEQNQDI
jgi:SAM-dependent methyltransferase